MAAVHPEPWFRALITNNNVLADGWRSETVNSSKFMSELSVHPSYSEVPNSLLSQVTCYTKTLLSQSSSVATAW
jgi:hypothetical protein